TANISKYVTENTKLIWIETPTNPTMRIVDIAAAATIAKANNLLDIPQLTEPKGQRIPAG
ncbi:MAG: hypothetical protein EBU23_16440, partial [Mycobacteriaceae bacterium]|nr:hypothetical protein [Mycobacteriaceae bacterium]